MSELVITGVAIEETRGWRTRLGLDGLASYIGYECTEESRGIVPVDTGALKGSLRYDVDGTSVSAIVVMSANTFYAIFVELGTKRAAAQPYLLPALKRGVEVALRSWRLGKRRAMDSGSTITAREAGMDRARRSTAVAAQTKRDAANAARQVRAGGTP